MSDTTTVADKYLFLLKWALILGPPYILVAAFVQGLLLRFAKTSDDKALANAAGALWPLAPFGIVLYAVFMTIGRGLELLWNKFFLKVKNFAMTAKLPEKKDKESVDFPKAKIVPKD